MRIIQSTTIIEKSKQNNLKFYNVYKRIKEVGELTLEDLTVIPSPHPPVANGLYFSLQREYKKSCASAVKQLRDVTTKSMSCIF